MSKRIIETGRNWTRSRLRILGAVLNSRNFANYHYEFSFRIVRESTWALSVLRIRVKIWRLICGSDDNSEFSVLETESDKITRKLDELQMALGSEYLVQYWKVKITQYSNTTYRTEDWSYSIWAHGDRSSPLVRINGCGGRTYDIARKQAKITTS